jgi:hypothetical protein
MPVTSEEKNRSAAAWPSTCHFWTAEVYFDGRENNLEKDERMCALNRRAHWIRLELMDCFYISDCSQAGPGYQISNTVVFENVSWSFEVVISRRKLDAYCSCEHASTKER